MQLIQKIALVIFLSKDVFGAATITSREVRGNWDSKDSWTGGIIPTSTDDVVIKAGATIFIQGSVALNNLTIESGATLIDNGTGTIAVSGDVLVNGNWAGSAAIALNGQSKNMSGKGVISNSSTLTITGIKLILTGTELIKSNGSITLNSNTTVINNGSVTINGSLIGVNGTSSVWTNAENSTLTISGALLATGVLHASAPNNTVNFAGIAAQNVKRPASGVFHHLIISGTSTPAKQLITGNYTINGNLTIYSSLDANGRSITLLGNWINQGAFASGAATVSFNGSSLQYISSISGESFYNLTVNNSAGVSFDNNTVATNSLTMTTGNVNIGKYILTLGSSTTTGAFSRQGGIIVGKFERWLMTSGLTASIVFPVGTSASYRPLSLQLSSLTHSGSIIVEFVNGHPGNITSPPLTDADGNKTYNTFSDGYWSFMSANSFATNSYSLSLTLNDFAPLPRPSFNGIDNKTRLLTRTSTSLAWSLTGTHVASTSTNMCSRSGLVALNAQYCLGDDTNCSSALTSSITATSGTDVCAGSSLQTYSVLPTAGSTYAWSVVSGGTILSGQGTNEISVNWSVEGGRRSVSVVESNGCNYGVPVVLNVNVHPLPLEKITGKTNVSANSLGVENYTVPSLPGYSYTWNLNADALVGAITQGVNMSEVSVLWKGKGMGILQLNASYSGCSTITSAASLPVNVYDIIQSLSSSGNWSSPNTWSCNCVPGANDQVVIQSGHVITIDKVVGEEVKNIRINGAATLNTSANPFTIYGDLVLHGTMIGTGQLTLAGSGVLDGTGSITTVPVTISTNHFINTTAFLSKTSSTGSFIIGQGVTVTNNGFISLAGGLTAASTTSTWINADQSTLSVGGALFSSPSGTLHASADGNAVVYTGATSNNIKVPANSGQYFHIAFSGTGTNRLPAGAEILVKGNFTNDGSFSPSNGTVTFNGNTTVSGSAITGFNHVIINPASTLKAAGTIQVAGDFTNHGTFEGTGGTLVFNGTGTQLISGNSTSTFHNLVVNNGPQPTDLIFATPQMLEGVLTLSVGAVAESKGNLTLLSSADSPSADASIGPLQAGSSVIGDVIVERYISAEPPTPRRGLYRYIASPVTNATISQWQQSFAITGNFDGASTSDPLTGSKTYCGGYTFKPGNASLFVYNEVAQDYNAFPSRINGTSSSSPITPGKGYAAYIALKDCNSPVTLRVKGMINQASSSPFDFTPLITYTYSPTANYIGYNLIGNPFPSSIDWGAGEGAWIKNNISSVIAIRDNGSGPGRFVYIDETDPVISNRVIASGQAFWVRATAKAPSLKIMENAKVSGVTHAFYRQANLVMDKLTITLTNANLQDEAYIKINPFSKPSLDDFDGPKMSNSFFDISTLSSDGVSLAVNSINESICGVSIPLRIVKSGANVMDNGRYSLSFLKTGFFCNGFTILLRDNYTGEVTDVSMDPGYSFTVSSASPGASAADRFSITFLEKPVPLDNPVDARVTICGKNPAVICVKNTSFNVNYFAALYGRAVSDTVAGPSTLRLTIPSRLLSANTDTVYVMAQTVCSTQRLNRFSIVKKDTVVYKAKVSDVIHCGAASFTIQANGSPYGYRWYDSLSSFAPIYSGDSFITPVLSESRQYFVTAINHSGCEGDRVLVNATISHRDPGILAQSAGGFSCGAGSVTLNATSNLSSMSFYWYDSVDSTVPVFCGPAFVTPVLSKSRMYYVSAANSKMCEGFRAPVNAIVVNIDPVTVLVSDDLKELRSSSENGNQWYKDGQVIAGATSQKYRPVESGNYAVAVSSNGCQAISPTLPFIVTGVEESNSDEVKIYPNPCRDWIVIQINESGPVQATFYQITGQELDTVRFEEERSMQIARCNLASFCSGVYILKLTTISGQKFFKITKE